MRMARLEFELLGLLDVVLETAERRTRKEEKGGGTMALLISIGPALAIAGFLSVVVVAVRLHPRPRGDFIS
jgi:hypothetical protein